MLEPASAASLATLCPPSRFIFLSLRLGVLTCNMGIITPTTTGYTEGRMRK
jgi:hypothetical protein